MKEISVPALRVNNVSKIFKSLTGDNNVLANINFLLNQEEIIGIRGENGSGKTTLFNIIAGIETPTKGNIEFYNNHKDRLKVGVVFQNYNSTLLPWLNVQENISIPLKICGFDKTEIREKLEEVLAKLKFDRLPLKKYPHQLSGGQKQRVAIARSLIRKPDVLLLDEPFSNLDFQTSLDLQDIIQEIRMAEKISVILVSHDLDHILFLADKVLILSGHPSTFDKEFCIDFPIPRKRSLLLSESFELLRNKILEYEYSIYQNG